MNLKAHEIPSGEDGRKSILRRFISVAYLIRSGLRKNSSKSGYLAYKCLVISNNYGIESAISYDTHDLAGLSVRDLAVDLFLQAVPFHS